MRSLKDNLPDFDINTMSVFEYVTNRQFFNTTLPRTKISDFKHRQMPFLFKPSKIALGKTDKVFASQWLDERKVICGTKCNKLLVLDVLTKEQVNIPMLQGSRYSVMPQASAGVHDIAINQNRTLLATSGENPNHLAVYRLPTFDPLLVGENHNDWVFGTEWLTDTIIATGSRDGSISLWDVNNVQHSSSNRGSVTYTNNRQYVQSPILLPKTSMKSPLNEDKIRDLAYNSYTGHIAALSSNAFLYIWDIASEKRLSTIILPFEYENVCLAMDKDRGLYAVGSQSNVSFFDLRTDKNVLIIKTEDVGAGVRSVSFKDSLVTIGTGHGSVFFYDLNNKQYLKKYGQTHCLKSGKGWLRLDSTVYEFFTDEDVDCFKNAIYTHCYDPTETKLFTAGGPLALVLYGNYAALWE